MKLLLVALCAAGLLTACARTVSIPAPPVPPGYTGPPMTNTVVRLKWHQKPAPKGPQSPAPTIVENPRLTRTWCFIYQNGQLRPNYQSPALPGQGKVIIYWLP